jgi:hypothetical protein
MSEQAIAALIEARDKTKQDCDERIAEFDRVIATLRSGGIRDEPRKDTPKVRVGQYAGMEKTPALQAYLHERGGEATVERAAVDLALGGVDMGLPKRHAQNLRIAISANKSKFQYDDKSDIVRLVKRKS